jgi:DNA-binding transcriptional MocR family regulator
MKKNKEHKYIQIAEAVEQLINDEVIRIGEKLPSIRQISKQYGVNAGTIFQAYYNLEAKGLIEAKPQSGYYVKFNRKRYPALPDVQQTTSALIGVTEMVTSVFENIGSKDILNFSINAPSISLLPIVKLNKSILHALRSTDNGCVTYEPIQGNIDLRKQIIKHSLSWNARIKIEEVVVTNGCMEALSICLQAVTKPGDTIVIESPTFFGFYQLIQNLRLNAIEVSTDPITGINIHQLAVVLKKKKIAACLLVPNFNNPLGSCIPDHCKKQLVKLITEYHIPLIEDDIYGELYFGKHRPHNCKTYDKEGLVLSCGSFSKSLAAGYRIGWCLPGKFLEKVKELKSTFSICSTTLTQVALAHFLIVGRYDFHLKKLRRALHIQSLRYIQGILEHFPEDVKLSRPNGGFVLWIELNKSVNAFKLRQEALKYNISIAPGPIFSAKGEYTNYIRLSYGNPYDTNVEYGLTVLGSLAKKLSK